jgi:hypothetical protein
MIKILLGALTFFSALMSLCVSSVRCSKIELEESDVNLRECVEAAIDVCAQKALAKGLEIIGSVTAEVPFSIRCDPSRFKQILFNLLSNSVKFTSEGQVIISMDAQPIEAPIPFVPVLSASTSTSPLAQSSRRLASTSSISGVAEDGHLSVLPHSSAGETPTSPMSPAAGSVATSSSNRWYRLRVEVSDSGIGIGVSAQKRLFTSFSQAHREINGKYGGTGLGLAISKSLVELLGGQIGLDSTLGQGSTFFFSLNVRGTSLTEVAAAQLPPHLHQATHLTELATPSQLSSHSAATSSATLSVVSLVIPPDPAMARRSVLLVHHNPRISRVLCDMLQQWNLDVTCSFSFEPYKACWSMSAPPPFATILFNAATVLAANDSPYIQTLYSMTRGTITTLVVFLPLGSVRRSLEVVTDYIVSQPIKMANLYAAVQHKQTALPMPATVPPLVPSNVSPSKSSAGTDAILFSRPCLLSKSASVSAFVSSPSPAPMTLGVPISLSGLATFANTYPLHILVAEDNSINQRLISKVRVIMCLSPGQLNEVSFVVL